MCLFGLASSSSVSHSSGKGDGSCVLFPFSLWFWFKRIVEVTIPWTNEPAGEWRLPRNKFNSFGRESRTRCSFNSLGRKPKPTPPKGWRFNPITLYIIGAALACLGGTSALNCLSRHVNNRAVCCYNLTKYM